MILSFNCFFTVYINRNKISMENTEICENTEAKKLKL